METLEKYEMITKRSLFEINATAYVKENESRFLNLSEFNKKTDLWFFKVSEQAISKKKFANEVSSFDELEFINFKPLLEKIKEIIEL